MAHCVSIQVEIDGKEIEMCTTHVPGNEALKQDIEAGKVRKPTTEEVNRAIDYWKSSRPKDRHKPNPQGHPWKTYSDGL